MCDASDFAVGVVLGQRIEKHFKPIHYASKTMTEAESNYTTMGKEMLAVVYAFEKFRSYLIMNKSIAKKLSTSSQLAIVDLPGDITVPTTPPKRFFIQDLIGQQVTKMPSKLENKAFWALKHANFDLKATRDHRKLQLNELHELRDQAYENPLIYKEKTKNLHDSKIKNRIFNVGDQVLLFNSRLKIFSGKLKTRWSGPFTITEVYPYGTAKLAHADGLNFKVNCHRLKHYYGGDVPPMKSKAELQRRKSIEYASEMELECAKVKGDLLSYKMEYERSYNKYTQTINDLNQTVLELKEKLSAHQDTISILKQQKDAQIKLYKTQEDKDIEKVIDLENKVKAFDNIVYKTGQSVQTMNMLNNKCRTSFAKPEYLKKAKQANPRLNLMK
nr:reverse transcriptase domain-containing protein [Tanacetum cinerariifolium]